MNSILTFFAFISLVYSTSQAYQRVIISKNFSKDRFSVTMATAFGVDNRCQSLEKFARYDAVDLLLTLARYQTSQSCTIAMQEYINQHPDIDSSAQFQILAQGSEDVEVAHSVPNTSISCKDYWLPYVIEYCTVSLIQRTAE